MRSAFFACVLVCLSIFTSPLIGQGQNPNVPHPPRKQVSTPSGDQASGAPQQLTECEGGQCGAWVFEGSRGLGMWAKGAIADLTIRQFDGRRIVIYRDDPVGSFSSPWGINGHFTALYTGTINGDQVRGTVLWNGRDSGVWSATLSKGSCSRDCPLETQQMLDLGADLYQAGLHVAAARYWRPMAVQGNSDAEAYLAEVMYEQKGDAAAAREAFDWATKSADQGNGSGELVLGSLYKHGYGTPVNMQQAKYWINKGQADTKAQQAQAQQQAQMQQAQSDNKALLRDLAIAAIVTAYLGGGGTDSPSPSGTTTEDIQRRTNEMNWYQQGGAAGGPPPGWTGENPD